jgi:hypothetical protein
VSFGNRHTDIHPCLRYGENGKPRTRLWGVFAVAIVALSAVWQPTGAIANPDEYGFESVGASISTTQAGAHPEFTTSINFKTDAEGRLPASTRDTHFAAPPGLLANPHAVSQCAALQLLETDLNDPSNVTGCPQDSQIGVVKLVLESLGGNVQIFEPIYNLEPRFGEPARFGFIADFYAVFIDTKLRSGSGEDYGVTASSDSVSALIPLLSAQATLWGVPADKGHDGERFTPYEALANAGVPETPSGKRSSDLAPVPFMLNPTHCGVAQGVGVAAASYSLPDIEIRAFAPIAANTGCGLIDFSLQISSQPTTTQGETGSGLDFELTIPQDSLKRPNLLAQSEVKASEVTLPQGVTINPSVGEGLAVCTPAQLAGETIDSLPGEGCPNASNLGTLSAESPLIDEPVEGSIFLAQQDDPATTEHGAENPFDSLIALYFVIKNPKLGVIVKLPVLVEPDPKTGQLVVSIDGVPQIPLSHFSAHLRTGARAALITPAACGTYTTQAKFYPWSAPSTPTPVSSSFQITGGVNGGPCPTGGLPPFHPQFQAGSINNNAGSHSPFDMRLIRSDGEQDMTKFSATLPPGEIGSLVGVAKCPDSAIAAARAKTGRQEIASPSCPANSLIGHTLAGAGVGDALTYVGGQLYLGGPYHGDPLSVIAVTPAVAGPFDAGTVVVQEALTLNPKTAEVEVDGSRSDPIPHILKGIVLKLRDLRVHVDRPNFTLNPTSCDEEQTRSVLFGSYLNVLDPSDDRPIDLSTRYQAANCLNLGFKPKLTLNLKGGTRRGGHPALTAVYTPRKGDANIKGLVVRLPRSAFLDQAHIRTICTRVQFAAEACPKAARYGYIKAWTPLLEEPLEGPVYLRSSDHKLPDLVFDLHGLVDIEVDVRIDSAHGGIRATLESAPDAPLSKVVLRMQGAKKGLIVNSTNLCKGKHRAKANLSAHNGRRYRFRPLVRAQCGKAKHRKRRRHHR